MATTASEYYPYDAGSGANITEAQWRKMMGGINTHGVLAGYLNGLAVTGDSTGMQVKLATGACWINGAYGENSTSVQTLAIGASHATLNRYDIVVARNNYTSNMIEWDVVAGTPGASPTIPSATVDTTKYEIVLAYVYIAATASTITAANVTDQRQYNSAHNSFVRHVVLPAAGDTISLDNLPARKFLQVRFFVLPSGGTLLPAFRFNNDSGTNYAGNYIANFGPAASAVSTTSLGCASANSGSFQFGNWQIVNVSTQRKVVHGMTSDDNNASATTTSNSSIVMGKWDNTSTQITRVDLLNNGSGDFAIGSTMVVNGSDIPF